MREIRVNMIETKSYRPNESPKCWQENQKKIQSSFSCHFRWNNGEDHECEALFFHTSFAKQEQVEAVGLEIQEILVQGDHP